MHMPKLYVIIGVLGALVLTSIAAYVILQPSGDLLTDASIDAAQISPNADGVDDITTLHYTLTQPATVNVYFENPAGDRYYFRQDARRSTGTYSVLFSGVVDGYTLPNEEIPGDIERRLIPNGQYTWVITATDDDGETVEQSGALEIANADVALPVMTIFEINPAVFTPNQDGITDRVNVNVYLEKPAQLTVYLEDDAGLRYYMPEYEEGREPGDMGLHVFDYDGGVDQNIEPPADGEYIVHAIAQDDEGQRIARTGQLELRDGGLPQTEIIAQTTGTTVLFEHRPYDTAYYSDQHTTGKLITKPEGIASDLEAITLLQGDLLVFKLTVNNYGDTPIRTAGPFPGTVYDYDQVASAMGAYEESGAFRIGIKCNSSLSDFPYRWALAPEDELEAVYDPATDRTYYYMQPGQRAEVWGAIRMTRIIQAANPQDCWAGLIHEDVQVVTGQSVVGLREIEVVPRD